MRRLLLSLNAVLLLTPVLGQTAPAPDMGPSKYERRVAQYEAQAKINPLPVGGIVFCGSSSIDKWTTLTKDFPDFPVIKHGVSGTDISEATYFADRLILPLKPKQVILYAGSNDLVHHKSPQDILAEYQAFVAKIRGALPEAQISFISIAPCASRWDRVGDMKQANGLIKDYIATQQNMDYIDLFPHLLGTDGLPNALFFLSDRLHPSAEGYKIWTAVIRPYLKN